MKLPKNPTRKKCKARKPQNKSHLLKKASTRLFKQAQTPQNNLPSKTYTVKQYQAELNNAWKEAIRRATRGGGVNKHWANYLKGNVPSAKEYLKNPPILIDIKGPTLKGKPGPQWKTISPCPKSRSRCSLFGSCRLWRNS